METFLWTVVVVVGTWWGVTGWFFALAKAAEIRDEGYADDLGQFIKWGIYPYLAIGVLLDVLFNVIYGSWIFREIPKEFLFTNRVKRHVKESKGSRLDTANRWKKKMNIIMPGHV